MKTIPGPDKARYDDALVDYDVYYHSNHRQDYLMNGYLSLSKFFLGIFISEKGYVIDTGNFETANIILMEKVKRRIEKHPLLWKLFFMIA